MRVARQVHTIDHSDLTCLQDSTNSSGDNINVPLLVDVTETGVAFDGWMGVNRTAARRIMMED